MAKYYYAVVSRDNGKLLVNDSKLPIYWNKKVAQKVARDYNGSYKEFIVARILLSDLEDVIIQTPNQ